MATYIALVSGSFGFVVGALSTALVFAMYERKRK